MLGLLSLPAGAQPPAPAAAIEARLGTATPGQALALRGEQIAASRVLADFYTRRNFAPAWTRTRDIDDLLRAIRDSIDDGLDPSDYHFSALVQLRSVVSQPYATDVDRADFELLLTDAIVRLGYHFWFGKVDPQAIDPGWNMNRTLPGLDPAAEIESALATGDLHAAIERARPAHPLYVGLMRELARFRRVALAGGWPELPSGPTLEPGTLDARVPILREILVATGDLTGTASADAHAYDAPLEAAVRRFQQRMGLGADGRVGAATQAELRVPVEDRIRQLRVNLDRGRVLLFQLPHDFVVVNIAGFEAYYVRGTDILWRGRAQVGKPYRATP
ncbi:MAG: peptidoglycan-binding protein, partial [Steroidobacteraceae bacterium]|nr:peptidoglycan-binding protein [Steroidobacteraceae bacterium]